MLITEAGDVSWDGGLATSAAVAAADDGDAGVALTTGAAPVPLLLPSPASPSAILVSPETLSPSRSTPTVDLKSMQSIGGHQLVGGPSAPPFRDPSSLQQPPQQQIPNGAGLPRPAPVTLGSVKRGALLTISAMGA